MSRKLDCSRFGLLTSAMNPRPSATKGRGLLTALFVLCIILFCTSAHPQEPVQVVENPKDYVSEVLPYPIDEVHARAELLFDSQGRDFYDDYNPKIYDLPEEVLNYKNLSPEAYRKFMALPLVKPTKFYVFFGAYPNMQEVLAKLTPLAAMGHSNAGLQRYVQLQAEARAQDLYIWSPDTPWWHSEYTMGTKPLPFRAYFIMHLTKVDDAHTQVEIIENEPAVRLAGTTSVDAYGHVHDFEVREVEPTTSDREFLLSCVKQFMERKVPGRHWFNCKTAKELAEPAPVPFTVP